MSVDLFDRKLKALEQRLETLRRRAAERPTESQELLPQGLEELQADLEALQAADEELRQRNEQLTATSRILEAERQRYQELFEFAPDGYLVTDGDGIIREANSAVVAMLGLNRNRLVGRRLIEFLVEEEQRTFDSMLSRISQGEAIRDWEIRVQPAEKDPFSALLSVAVATDPDGQFVGLRWLLRDITERQRVESEIRARVRQQAAVAELGRYALTAAELPALLNKVVEAVSKTLDVEFSKVLELLPDGNLLLLRAGVGWKEGLVGKATVGAGRDSMPGHVLSSGKPVISTDLREESRFQAPPVLHEHHVVSSVAVPIPGQTLNSTAFGVLGAHTSTLREFTADDVNYLEAVANVLAAAIERMQTLDELEIRVRQRTQELHQTNSRLKREVAERRRAELALRESDRQVRRQLAELENLYLIEPVGLGLFDTDLRYLRVNERLAEINGRPASEHIGLQIRDVVPEIADVVEPIFRRVIDSGQPILNLPVEGTTPAQPDQIRYWLVSYHPVKSEDGGIVGVTVAVLDITDQKRAEEQAQQHLSELAHVERLRTAGALATGLAHELNQPLAAISLQAEVASRLAQMETDTSDDDLQEALGEITEQSQRASNIIRVLKSFVKNTQPHRSTVDVNQIVKNVVGLIGPVIRQHTFELSLDLADGLPMVLADLIQIEQVLLNLLNNAVEAMDQTDPGERHLEIRTSGGQNGTVEVSVRDSGPGLPDGNISQVFESFYTTKPEGMGMGLAISRSIVEAHGGRMSAANNPIRGATFSFSVPISGGANGSNG